MQTKWAKKLISALIVLVGIPLVMAVGVLFFGDRKYNIISMIIAILACAPFFLRFERQKKSSREMIIIAVMITLSSIGRFAFAPIPGFKPVTAMVVITAIYFGSEAGFITGAFSALLSNIFFGQGPWTPFQMFVWGFLGFFAGVLASKGLLDNKIQLSVYGVAAGIAFSLMMDVWTVISMDGFFNMSRYLVAVAASLPFMFIYAVSNIIFLLALEKPIGKRLERIKVKYQITNN
ncbi:MAG: ECF transporter S component [Firmicutes bacterium]|nr:ECF transporter S component [Bacillota bacterium]